MAILKNPAAACTPPSPHSRSRRSGVAANRRERATTNNQKSKNLKTGNMSSIVFGYRRNAGAKGTRSRFTVTQTTRVRRRSAAVSRVRVPRRPPECGMATTAVPVPQLYPLASGLWAAPARSGQRRSQDGRRTQLRAPAERTSTQQERARPRPRLTRHGVGDRRGGVSDTPCSTPLHMTACARPPWRPLSTPGEEDTMRCTTINILPSTNESKRRADDNTSTVHTTRAVPSLPTHPPTHPPTYPPTHSPISLTPKL